MKEFLLIYAIKSIFNFSSFSTASSGIIAVLFIAYLLFNIIKKTYLPAKTTHTVRQRSEMSLTANTPLNLSESRLNTGISFIIRLK